MKTFLIHIILILTTVSTFAQVDVTNRLDTSKLYSEFITQLNNHRSRKLNDDKILIVRHNFLKSDTLPTNYKITFLDRLFYKIGYISTLDTATINKLQQIASNHAEYMSIFCYDTVKEDGYKLYIKNYPTHDQIKSNDYFKAQSDNLKRYKTKYKTIKSKNNITIEPIEWGECCMSGATHTNTYIPYMSNDVNDIIALDIVNGLLSSPPHKKLLLNKDFKNIAISIKLKEFEWIENDGKIQKVCLYWVAVSLSE